MTNELIKILNKQHEYIRGVMRNIEKEASKECPDTEILLHNFSEFKKALLEHLELEDTQFYPQLEIKLKEQCEDPSEIIEFGKKMLDVSGLVKSFLKNYDSKEKIEKDIDMFRRDLVVMFGELSARITSEDVFVHSQWTRCTQNN